MARDDADPDLLALVEFRYDPGEPHGWRLNVQAATWMRTGALGRLLREAADRYDPPHPLLDLTAEHHPECTCPRCTTREVKADG